MESEMVRWIGQHGPALAVGAMIGASLVGTALWLAFNRGRGEYLSSDWRGARPYYPGDRP